MTPVPAPDAWPSLARAWEFCRYLAQRFEQDHCTRAAASLAYTSLLALVPLLTVVFVTLSAFPAFTEWRSAIEDFVFRNFVPALGDQVRGYMVEFTTKARGLRAAGVIALLVTVLAMMSTIESTFNVIWGIHRKRPLMIRFLVYWAVLTLGPILIGAGMLATSYVVSLPLLGDGAAGLRTHLIGVFPVLATTIAFVLFFKLIPYRPVPLRHALVGGIIASLLFELAKRGFAVYVTQFPSQQAIYGAFATLPIFLLWIYLSWVIVLLGAEITQCLTTFQAQGPRRGDAFTRDPLCCAYRVLLHLYRAQGRGAGLSDKEILQREPAFGFAAVNRALERLDEGGWISRNDVYLWVLMRDLHELELRDLLRLVPSFTPLDPTALGVREAADGRLLAALATLREDAAPTLATPLARLFGTAPEAAGEAPS
ncbi:MAG: virulence factor BrkB family protein [Gammaproteobacteria bacterium]